MRRVLFKTTVVISGDYDLVAMRQPAYPFSDDTNLRHIANARQGAGMNKNVAVRNSDCLLGPCVSEAITRCMVLANRSNERGCACLAIVFEEPRKVAVNRSDSFRPDDFDDAAVTEPGVLRSNDFRNALGFKFLA